MSFNEFTSTQENRREKEGSPEQLYAGTTINREDVIAEAAIKVNEDPKSNKKSHVVEIIARVKIREVLNANGLDSFTISKLNQQILHEAKKILELLDKTN